MVGHIERFNPAIKRLKDLIAAGRLGDIVSINVKRVGGLPPQRKGADVVIDLAIHDIDVANDLLGEYPKDVYGFKSRNLINDQADSAVLLLHYPKTSCFIEVNWVTPVKIRTMDITGTKSFARLDYINQTLVLYEKNYPSQDANFRDFNDFISKFSSANEIKVDVQKTEPLKAELGEFIGAISQDHEPLITGREAYQALETALKI
jgi:UDP-N-acetylglucosamine 3-dehydrogenase